MRRTRKSIAILCAVLAALLLLGGSLAYYTTEKAARNKITAGNVGIDLILEERLPNGTLQTAGPGMKIVPGREVSRLPRGKNTGKAPVYVRAKIGTTVTGQDGKAITPGAGEITFTGIDKDKWFYRDGYYYYLTPLESGESTGAVFEGVSFSKDMDGKYAGAKLQLDIVFEATQKAHNGDNALEAVGWPE